MFTVVAPTTSLSLDDHFIRRPAATFFVTAEGGGMAEHVQQFLDTRVALSLLNVEHSQQTVG